MNTRTKNILVVVSIVAFASFSCGPGPSRSLAPDLDDIPSPLVLLEGARKLDSGHSGSGFAWLHYEIDGSPPRTVRLLDRQPQFKDWERIHTNWLGTWIYWSEFDSEKSVERSGRYLKSVWRNKESGLVYTFNIHIAVESLHEPIPTDTTEMRIEQMLHPRNDGEVFVQSISSWEPEFMLGAVLPNPEIGPSE